MSTQTLAADWWARLRARGPRNLAFWMLGGLTWLYLVILTGGDLLSITVWSVPFLLMIAAVTTPWRTLSFATLFGLFMIGMGPVYLAALGAQLFLGIGPIEGLMRDLVDGLASAGFTSPIPNINKVIWAPVTEEVLKVVPLLVLLFWKGSGFKTLSGPIDYAVAGGVTGAGFALAEDISVRMGQGFLEGPPSDVFALRLGPLYRDLVGSRPGGRFGRSDFADNASFFFPEMQEIFGVVWSGHGALAFGTGLSIGLAVWLRRRLDSRLFYLAPPLVLLWAIWEHMMANWYGGAGCSRRDVTMCTLAGFDLRGRIFPILVLAGFALAVYLSGSVLRSYRRTDLALAGERLAFDELLASGWRKALSTIKDTLAFNRWRRRASYGTFHLEHMSRPLKFDMLAVLASRTRALVVARRLAGDPAEPIPEEAEALMTRVTPIR